MFVPLISPVEESKRSSKSLLRRKGGGGGHGGGGHGGGKGASKGTTKAPISSNAETSLAISSGGKSFKTSSTSSGGGAKSVIPSNQPFAGREVGGGTRAQVYGTSTYGSGYPGITGRGVQDRGFPFMFYPVVFAAPIGAGGYYLYREEEYGKAENTSRPGGSLRQVSFSSATSTFHVVADNSTIISLQTAVNGSCHSVNSFKASSILPYNSSETPYPRPEEAIQYYRASSVVLTLDGYNNTAALSNDETAPP
ncbi:hypothetical protein H0H87_006389, partial [Tephrocybe sp. NHM501043]